MLKETSDEESEWSKRISTYVRELNMNLETIKTKTMNEIKKNNKFA